MWSCSFSPETHPKPTNREHPTNELGWTLTKWSQNLINTEFRFSADQYKPSLGHIGFMSCVYFIFFFGYLLSTRHSFMASNSLLSLFFASFFLWLISLNLLRYNLLKKRNSYCRGGENHIERSLKAPKLRQDWVEQIVSVSRRQDSLSSVCLGENTWQNPTYTAWRFVRVGWPDFIKIM